MEKDYNENAWGQKSVLDYFDKNRITTKDLYPSEWFFLKDKLREGMSVLDIGCAKGFMANVLAENLQNFSYHGLDISQEMVNAAREKFPQHRFNKITDKDYSFLKDEQFDLVLCLGTLHIHETWRHTILSAWSHTKQTLIIDLREIPGNTIEDKKIAYLEYKDGIKNSLYRLPYNMINTAEALQTILNICENHSHIAHYGYLQSVSDLAVMPVRKVMANVYCISKDSCQH